MDRIKPGLALLNNNPTRYQNVDVFRKLIYGIDMLRSHLAEIEASKEGAELKWLKQKPRSIECG